jgi:lipopolysaccharide transport system permease protein
MQSPLPDSPLIRIRPRGAKVTLDLGDLWAYRELLYFLTWRDVKVRYKQTVLGVAWAIIQPLFTMLIFTLFFNKLVNVPSDGMPYPIFTYIAILPWVFFSGAVMNSSNSLVGNANLITKVYFPRLIIPAAAVGAGLVDLAIGFLILIGLIIYYQSPLTWGVIIMPPLIGLLTLLALAVGMLMSALNVKYRDIRYALPFFIQLWMFVTPIIYPTSLVPEQWRWLLMLNPLTGIIECFRSTLGGQDFELAPLAVSALITLAALAYSTYIFRRMENSFADIV